MSPAGHGLFVCTKGGACRRCAVTSTFRSTGKGRASKTVVTSRRRRTTSGAPRCRRASGPDRCTAGCASRRRSAPRSVAALFTAMSSARPTSPPAPSAPRTGPRGSTSADATRSRRGRRSWPGRWPPGVVDGQQAEHGVVPVAEPIEGGTARLVAQLGPVEGEVPGPQRAPVVPVLVAQRPDGAHLASFPRPGAEDGIPIGTGR